MIEFQRKIMGDPVRNKALAEALKHVIVPGKSIVADIGSGTGFLSFLASKLGAKHCYLYEYSGALELSKKIAKENGIKNCTFIKKHSMHVKNPVQADVVISETLGNFALEEHMLETLMDAKRFLKPGGALIPSSLRQFVCPVIAPRLWKEINVWKDIPFDLRWTAAEEMTLQNMYVKTVRPEELLSYGTQEWDRMDFQKKEKSIREATVRWTVAGDTAVYGFALFWECELLPGITLSTSPTKPATHWGQIFLPVGNPLKFQQSDEMQLTLRSDTRLKTGVILRWGIRQTRGGRTVAEQSLDMGKGLLHL
ncbi:MAG: methyltransferase domain-containing protein [Patescibacteria group bacterium]